MYVIQVFLRCLKGGVLPLEGLKHIFAVPTLRVLHAATRRRTVYTYEYFLQGA